MRNLAISSVETWKISPSIFENQSTASNVSAVTFDLDEQVVYAALENDTPQESASPKNHTVHSIQVSFIKVEAGILTVTTFLIRDPFLIEAGAGCAGKLFVHGTSGAHVS
jgi:hypothetical protein